MYKPMQIKPFGFKTRQSSLKAERGFSVWCKTPKEKMKSKEAEGKERRLMSICLNSTLFRLNFFASSLAFASEASLKSTPMHSAPPEANAQMNSPVPQPASKTFSPELNAPGFRLTSAAIHSAFFSKSSLEEIDLLG
ncbi:MAG: hypothetical protein V1494_05120 [Candidatus Diapherotrites archaeon]